MSKVTSSKVGAVTNGLTYLRKMAELRKGNPLISQKNLGWSNIIVWAEYIPILGGIT